MFEKTKLYDSIEAQKRNLVDLISLSQNIAGPQYIPEVVTYRKANIIRHRTFGCRHFDSKP